MITPQTMSDALKRNASILKLQAAGLSDADSFIQLPFRANCLNWTLGHILTNRSEILRLLTGQEPDWATQVERYKRESDPVTAPGAGVLALEHLLALIASSQEQIGEALATCSPEYLAKEIAFLGDRRQSRGAWLFFFFFHDSYHTGQTEILRQAAGVDDKII